MRSVLHLPSRDHLAAWLPKGGIGAEVGTFRGDFAATLLRFTRPTKLYLIDAWKHQADVLYPEGALRSTGSQDLYDRDHETVSHRFADAIREGTVEIRRGDSPEQLSRLPDGSLDWVYIDGDHREDAVRADLEAALPKMRRCGIICGDDYIAGNPIAGERFGVIEAVDTFCKRFQWSMVLTADHVWEGANYLNFALMADACLPTVAKRLERAYRWRYWAYWPARAAWRAFRNVVPQR